MIISWKLTVPAIANSAPRKAYVYLPAGYGEEQERRYPVIYMFDGHNLFDDNEATFGKSWGLSDYLDKTNTPIIVAAVECNHKGNSRLSEYSPADFTFHGEEIKGRGKKYMDWLVKEFKPYIDNNYLTLPQRENTAIGGSSMGGLMTLYAIIKYGKYFSKGAALSPSLWVNGGQTVETLLQSATFRKDTKIYLDYGEKEFSNHAPQREVFGKTCSTLIEKGAIVTARVVKGGTHCEASWEKQIPHFMTALFN